MTTNNNENPITPLYATQLIETIAKQEGFSDYVITTAAASKHGDGFMGIMHRVTINGKRTINGTVNQDQLSLICKMVPDDKVRRELFQSKRVFEREVYAYDVLLPAFTKFQEEKGIPREDGFYQFPKCYGTFSDPETGDYALVMEDLLVSGYEMWNKFNVLDLEHAKLTLTALGRYHAISFALRDQQPEVFNEFRKLKAELMLAMFSNDQSKLFMGQHYDLAAATLESHETDMKERFLTLKETFLSKMVKCCDSDTSEPFNVINHGDCWNNNIMYQYLEGSKRPISVCLIDWQVVQFCSPAIDLTYFLFSSTEKGLRDEHYDDLVRIYYDSLSEAVNLMGSDAEKMFPFADLLDQMKRFACYALMVTPIITPVLTAQAADIPDLDEIAHKVAENDINSIEDFVKGTDVAYRTRMGNIIRDYMTRNYDL